MTEPTPPACPAPAVARTHARGGAGCCAGLVAVACGAARSVVPIAVTGSAALTAAITGELLEGVAVAAVIPGAVLLLRRRSGCGC